MKYRVRSNIYAARQHDSTWLRDKMIHEMRLKYTPHQVYIVSFEPQHITPGNNRRYDVELEVNSKSKRGAKSTATTVLGIDPVNQVYIRSTEKVPERIRFEVESTMGTALYPYKVHAHGLLHDFANNNLRLLRENIDQGLRQVGASRIDHYDIHYSTEGLRQWEIVASIRAADADCAESAFRYSFTNPIWKELTVLQVVEDYTYAPSVAEASTKITYNYRVKVVAKRDKEYVEKRAAKLLNACPYVADWEIVESWCYGHYSRGEWCIELFVRYNCHSYDDGYKDLWDAIEKEQHVIAWSINKWEEVTSDRPCPVCKRK